MKKLLLIPFFAICLVGARPISVEPHDAGYQVRPVSTKIDSVNVKAVELLDLVKKL